MIPNADIELFNEDLIGEAFLSNEKVYQFKNLVRMKCLAMLNLAIEYEHI